ncbi:hypothetical protein N0V88_003212 [Collariella sp. IMI 366227]|nr:hypothetical protein N0V88_003212 [Collariella sp. IMI 366227]
MPGLKEATTTPNGAVPRRLGAIKEKKGMPDVCTASPGQKLDIIDIRRAAVEINLKTEILSMFRTKDGPRQLPTLLLYDERGLQLFEKITYLEEYYLTNDEIEILQSFAAEMVKNIPSGSMLIELGSGNLRKVNLLLQALEDATKTVDYYALDLSQQELERTLAQLPQYKYVRAHGLLGTYDDGQSWLREPSVAPRQKCILSLGSSVGNFDRADAADFLKSFADVLGPGDTMLIGLDACNDPAKVYHAYNDKEGLTHDNETRTGVSSVNTSMTLKEDATKPSTPPRRDTTVMGELVRPHERVQIEQSLKYSAAEATELWTRAAVHMLTKPKMAFSLIPSVYARSALPSLVDWEGLWAAWDVLTKTTKEAPTDPACYSGIFERGIDPDVDNPEQCHAHSEIPDEWPSVNEILAYQGRVRSRLRGLYAGGVEAIPRHVGRAVWVGFEHEVMHLETLLYMMLQSDRTLPPPHVPVPNWEDLAVEARSERVKNEWFEVPAQEIIIGMDDPEDGTDVDVHYGWDNEKPVRHASVKAFLAQGRPISNEEYARYMHSTHTTKIPASWAHAPGTSQTNGEVAATNSVNVNGNGHTDGSSTLPESFLEGKAVRTVYGLVPLKYALDWPIFASYDELAGCAAWMGGRIPTFEEARSIYTHVDARKKEEAQKKLSQMVPAVNGHLCNNGVEISPPATPPASSSSDTSSTTSTTNTHQQQEDLFTDLATANIGFQHWHPVPITSRGNVLAGQAELGGVWEWTSSALRRWDEFEPMTLYPAVNWYQRNYPYAWVGARVVRDLE